MPVDQGRLNRWLNKDARRGVVYRTLKHASVNINYIYDEADSLKWGLIVSLPAPLMDVLATRREILIWASLHERVQARDLQDAFAILRKPEHKLRLSQDVVLFICADRGGGAFVSEATQHEDTTVVTVPDALFRNCKPNGSDELIDLLRPRLYSIDLYDLKSPVTRSVDFFGAGRCPKGSLDGAPARHIAYWYLWSTQDWQDVIGESSGKRYPQQRVGPDHSC